MFSSFLLHLWRIYREKAHKSSMVYLILESTPLHGLRSPGFTSWWMIAKRVTCLSRGGIFNYCREKCVGFYAWASVGVSYPTPRRAKLFH